MNIIFRARNSRCDGVAAFGHKFFLSVHTFRVFPSCIRNQVTFLSHTSKQASESEHLILCELLRTFSVKITSLRFIIALKVTCCTRILTFDVNITFFEYGWNKSKEGGGGRNPVFSKEKKNIFGHLKLRKIFGTFFGRKIPMHKLSFIG